MTWFCLQGSAGHCQAPQGRRFFQEINMLYVFKTGNDVKIIWNATAPKQADRRKTGLISAIKTFCAG
jgi:hypothetical protein